MSDHDGPVHTVAFTGDGQRVLTLSGSTARLWPVDPLPVALRRKPRELTAAERQRYQIRP